MVACADVMEEAQNRALVYRMLAQVFFAPLSSRQVEKLVAVDWKRLRKLKMLCWRMAATMCIVPCAG